MTCVIFDIDGTLVDSAGFEDRLYVAALREVLGSVSIRSEFREFEHVTDSGILREICSENGIDIQDCEYKVRTRFGELLSEELTQNPSCVPIPGAVTFVQKLRSIPKFELGIATGGWGHSARMKLARAGFNVDDVPFASSDDGHERVRIMERCRSQMSAAQTVIYVGDGEWDMKATEILGWRFIGIGERLRGRCKDWIPDFLEVDLHQMFCELP